jgi:hypothetical protein
VVFVVPTGPAAFGLLMEAMGRRDSYLSLWDLGTIHVSSVAVAV